MAARNSELEKRLRDSEANHLANRRAAHDRRSLDADTPPQLTPHSRDEDLRNQVAVLARRATATPSEWGVLLRGGKRPPHSHRLGVIVPFRNVSRELELFVPHMTDFLNEQVCGASPFAFCFVLFVLFLLHCRRLVHVCRRGAFSLLSIHARSQSHVARCILGAF